MRNESLQWSNGYRRYNYHYCLLFINETHRVLVFILQAKANLYVRVLLFKKFPSTCYGTTCTYPRNKCINFPSRAFPYLWSSGFIMYLTIEIQITQILKKPKPSLFMLLTPCLVLLKIHNPSNTTNIYSPHFINE
jgi:hypothetical protein